MPTKGYPAMKFEDDSQYAEIVNEIGLEMSIIRTEWVITIEINTKYIYYYNTIFN